MAARRNDRVDRESRDRLRQYQARLQLHERQRARRRKDNILASVVAAAVLAGATAAQVAYFGTGPGLPEPVPTASATATATPEAIVPVPGQNVGDVPAPDLAEGRTWTGTLTLNGIPLAVELDGAAAPQATASLVSLSRSGFYDGTPCHRLTSGGLAVLQCGDPTGTGTGGPGYYFGPIENAPPDGVYPAGALALANSGDPYSNGSQFFLVYDDSTLPPDYTVVGRVVSGLDELRTAVLDAGVEDGGTDGAPAVPTTVDSFTVS